MDINLANNKIKLCIIGTGNWGQKVSNVANMFDRYELIGTINSSTSQDEKYSLMKSADMIYIAIPKENQLEYINFCIENDKFAVCEAPFLNSLDERKSVFNKIKTFKPRSFFINSAYFLDTDFARIMGEIMSSKSNFISVHCSGPKYSDNLEQAKKFYANQSIFLLSQLAHSRQIEKFDRFIINDDYSGLFDSKGYKFEFKWSYSEAPKNTFQFGKDNNIVEKTLIYDQYDHIFPLLKYVSDQYYGIYLPILQNRTPGEISSIYAQVTVQAYLISCTAENFSDIFCDSAPGTVIDDPTELFFNGGL